MRYFDYGCEKQDNTFSLLIIKKAEIVVFLEYHFQNISHLNALGRKFDLDVK